MKEKEIYYYKGNPYTILKETKIKVCDLWKDCVVYKCEYNNPDGDIWVRQRQDFFELFKPKSNRPSMSIIDYLDVAHTYSNIPKENLIEYTHYGALAEIGELTGKIVKSLRGDYIIVEDGLIPECTDYITHKDLMLEVGDIIWMVHMRDRNCLTNRVETGPTNTTDILRIIGRLTQDWTNAYYKNLVRYLLTIIYYYGYTLEEVLYLNIEKLEQRRISGTIKGNGDNR